MWKSDSAVTGRFCTACGSSISPDARFCPNCSAILTPPALSRSDALNAVVRQQALLWFYRVAGTAAAIGILALIATQCGTKSEKPAASGVSGTAIRSTSTAAIRSSGSGSQNSSTAARNVLIDSINQFIDDVGRVPADETSTTFSTRARTAAASASNMATTAQGVRSSIGAFSTCADATEAAGSVGAQYWQSLARASLGGSIDAPAWNSALDRYQVKYQRAVQTMSTACK